MWKPWSRLSTKWGTKLVVSKKEKLMYLEQGHMRKHPISQTNSHEIIGRKTKGDTRTARHEALPAPGSEAEIQD